MSSIEYWQVKNVLNLVQTVNRLISYNKSVIAQKERQGKVQVVLDFTFLKSLIEKGGLILNTVSCPYCNGTVELPASGDTFNCRYCSKQIRAVDIFLQRLRNYLEIFDELHVNL
jgi:tRNA(Ile2) C34 agmatinyltransferase TiaS